METRPRITEGKRICQVIRVKPERLEEYKEVHSEVWPQVLDTLKKANIVDYTIHYFAPLSLLIAHLRYLGKDYEADMALIRSDETTRRWWALTDGMQESFVDGAVGSENGEWWMNAEEVFRME
ncbi:hypothetical protein M231_01302 [Tremella mesenterica]|uniref:L-rhamnose mutarotase n=1 Tax=Tremella mesenterica TaxID=5217 RepID=A0A4V1M4S6_TREME|nr:hypothetical protein M231_01302 [Tremella mesenterica]